MRGILVIEKGRLLSPQKVGSAHSSVPLQRRIFCIQSSAGVGRGKFVASGMNEGRSEPPRQCCRDLPSQGADRSSIRVCPRVVVVGSLRYKSGSLREARAPSFSGFFRSPLPSLGQGFVRRSESNNTTRAFLRDAPLSTKLGADQVAQPVEPQPTKSATSCFQHPLFAFLTQEASATDTM